MNDLNKFMDNAKGFADFVGQKAVDAAEISRQFARKKSIEYKINEKYKELGRVCFDMQRNGTDATDVMNSLIGEIDLLSSELRAAEEDSIHGRICRVCGTVNDNSNNFCAHCGNSL